MADTPERRVKKALVKILESFGGDLYWFYPVASGYGAAGIPDIIVCYRGKFISIECKGSSDDMTTALQERAMTKIDTAGGLTLVVKGMDEVHDIKPLLQILARKERT